MTSSSALSELSRLTIGWSSLAERAASIVVPAGAEEVEIIVTLQGDLDGRTPDEIAAWPTAPDAERLRILARAKGRIRI